MRFYLYSVKCKSENFYYLPSGFKDNSTAIKNFEVVFLKQVKNPNDYELWKIGEFDQSMKHGLKAYEEPEQIY